MDKKIMSLFLLLIIVIAATITYVVSNQISTEENQINYNSSEEDVTEEEISNELNDIFLDENDEIEIGEMI